MSFGLKHNFSMFFLWLLGRKGLPVKENRAAAIQYKKQKLSLLLTKFKRERFNGLSRAGVSIYELPVTLLQQTVLISNGSTFSLPNQSRPLRKHSTVSSEHPYVAYIHRHWFYKKFCPLVN